MTLAELEKLCEEALDALNKNHARRLADLPALYFHELGYLTKYVPHLIAVARAAELHCSDWDAPGVRESFYKKIGLEGCRVFLDPDYRHIDRLGLGETLAKLRDA